MSSSAFASASDPKSEPKHDKKEETERKAQVKTLRITSKAKLKEYMQRIVSSPNIKDEADRANSHLSNDEKKLIKQSEFPDNKPVITGYLTGDVRDRPVIKIDGKNFYCSNVAFFYYLSNIKHADEDLTKKDAVWWMDNYPFEWEVSHLFDGIRPDVNPLNLVMEPHDVNKSRVFCRLLFEKRELEYRKTMAEDVASNKAKSEALKICGQLHDRQCKFLHPSVGRLVDATLKRRRNERKASTENKKKQKQETKEKVKAKETEKKEAKKAKSVDKKERIAEKRTAKKRKANDGAAVVDD